MSAFFCKKSAFFGQNSTFTQSKCESCVWDFLVVFSFCNIKGYYQWKYKFYRLCVRNPVPHCSKLAVNWKNGNDVTISQHDVIVNSFWRCFVVLGKFTGKIYRKNYQEKLTFFKNKFVYLRLKFSWKSSIKF